MKSQICYNERNKATFHVECKKALRNLAKAMGLDKWQYDLSVNKGGIAVSGEVTLHTEKVYVQVSEPLAGSGSEILFRSCNGRKDYSGGQNRFAPVEALESLENFAEAVTNVGNSGR